MEDKIKKAQDFAAIYYSGLRAEGLNHADALDRVIKMILLLVF